ncbi:methyl-accepting chemotaxis protein [Rhodoferax mekongensis]|uniref:Methyl-accepting chemotaxis protein n=1 Tax=Rhodoferax mekongensis TaxID=3068341 RepID=A0ABZ0AYX4_9BURK|nr:methyl-accepting chemotaxis protein [Rhodoferax sp. TBRC 17307]WNO04351.1 methyl-accepting chemotaxis protein [Rhodoferax sp. TBRC 17307]
MPNSVPVVATRSVSAPAVVATPSSQAPLSDLNLAARQRMLSQRVVMQTLLAASGDKPQLAAACKTFQLFCDSEAQLLATLSHYDEASARQLRAVYEGPQGIGVTIETFMDRMRRTLEAIERGGQVQPLLSDIVGSTDEVLEALNKATSTFDAIAKAKSERLFKELGTIVSDIHTIAREAKIVSFNAQVIAARAGNHGREFAVVANVLSGISTEIDGLTKKALHLADRKQHA